MSTLVILSFLPLQTATRVHGNSAGYIIGGIIAILILGYLVYTLLHPEKF
jgi:K+-transporting ATPase KdpF subunit